MDTLTHIPAATRLPSVPAILAATALAAAGSAGLNLLLRYGAVTVFDIPQPQFEPLIPGAVATSSVVAAVAGGLFFALLSRLTRRPLRIFVPTAGAVLALSMIPALAVGLDGPSGFPGGGAAAAVTLMLMHVVVAVVLTAALWWTRRPAASGVSK